MARSFQRPGLGDTHGAPLRPDLLHRLEPQGLGALVRRHGHADAADGSTQEAVLATTHHAEQLNPDHPWPSAGVPVQRVYQMVSHATPGFMENEYPNAGAAGVPARVDRLMLASAKPPERGGRRMTSGNESQKGGPDPKRLELFQRALRPSRVWLVAEAIAVASEEHRRVYVERSPSGWRWSLVTTGGPYPLLRLAGVFLKADYRQLVVGGMAIGEHESVWAPEAPIPDAQGTVLSVEQAVNPSDVLDLMGDFVKTIKVPPPPSTSGQPPALHLNPFNGSLRSLSEDSHENRMIRLTRDIDWLRRENKYVIFCDAGRPDRFVQFAAMNDGTSNLYMEASSSLYEEMPRWPLYADDPAVVRKFQGLGFDMPETPPNTSKNFAKQVVSGLSAHVASLAEDIMLSVLEASPSYSLDVKYVKGEAAKSDPVKTSSKPSYRAESLAAMPQELLETLRAEVLGLLKAGFVVDPSYSGPGKVYMLGVRREEMINTAVMGLISDPDEYLEDPDYWGIWRQLTGGGDETLISFYVASMTSDSFGLEYATVGELSVISAPGDLGSDIPTSVMRALQPASSQEPFNHAFLDLYARATEWDTTPPYPPSNDTVTIQGVGTRVGLPLLVKAMAQHVDRDPSLWLTIHGSVSGQGNEGNEPAATVIAKELEMPLEQVDTAMKLAQAPADEFKGLILSSRPELQRAVIGAYAAALGYAKA